MVQMCKHAVHQQNLASLFGSTSIVLLVKLIMTKPTGLVTQPTFDFSAVDNLPMSIKPAKYHSANICNLFQRILEILV